MASTDNNDVVLGIDPGLDGGIALMQLDQRLVMSMIMPVLGKKGQGKREIDTITIVRWIKQLDMPVYYKIQLCAVEQVHAMKGQGVTSTFTFGKGYGILQGILVACGVPTVYVQPTTWKKEVLVGTKKDKCAAISYCQARFPTVQLIPEGCRVPHDGMADALCIADYARRLVQGTQVTK